MLDPAHVPALFILGTLLTAAILIIIFLWGRYETLLSKHEELVQDARKDSVDRSRRTLKGQIAEQMAPLLPGFRYLAADARFLGDPIDYIVFSGHTESPTVGSEGDEMEIVLLEIKQGQAKLSPVQRAIAKAIEQGRVRFEVSRISDESIVTTEEWRSGRVTGPRKAETNS